MEKRIWRSADPNDFITMQTYDTTCPRCHEAVRFAIQEEDRSCKQDMKYYKEYCGRLAKENSQLREDVMFFKEMLRGKFYRSEKL